MRIPEACAAYVIIGTQAQAPYLKADIIARPSWLGFGRTYGDAMMLPRIVNAEHKPAPTTFLAGGDPGAYQPASLALAPNLPGRAELPVVDPFAVSNAALPQLTLVLSPALRGVAFSTSLTRANLPVGGGRARVWVELGDTGKVVHALVDSADPTLLPPAALIAIRTGSGTNAASGWVDLLWAPQKP